MNALGNEQKGATAERQPDPQFTRLVDSFGGDVKAAVEWMRSYALTKEEEAAPDLLAALKLLVNPDRVAATAHLTGPITITITARNLRTAAAAIAKATA